MTTPLREQYAPASDEDYALLERALATRSWMDLDALLGVFHALAVAPSGVSYGAWYPAVFPDGIDPSDDTEGTAGLDAIVRVLADVFDAIEHGEILAPAADDLEAVRSFARGFAFAAALDPFWRGDPNRWTYAAYAAAMGGLDELATESVLEDRASDANFGATFARDLTAMILDAFDAFADVRAELRQLPDGVRPPRVRAFRTGRNDPCPCGSGKKYKRCCLVARDEP